MKKEQATLLWIALISLAAALIGYADGLIRLLTVIIQIVFG